jgi:uncharacterized membrane protein
MSLESSRKLGLTASLINVVLPIVGIALIVALIFEAVNSISSTISSGSTFSTSPVLPALIVTGVLLGIIGLVGIILFLVGMHRLGEYYQEPRIFTNALYGFLTSIIGGIVVAVIFFAVAISSIINSMPTTSTPSTTTPTFALGVLGALLGVGIGSIIVLIISAYFTMRAFNLLGEKSGVHSFNTAGTLYIIGAVLELVGIGAILLWIAWIFAALGFNALKPKPTETAPTYPSPSYVPPPTATSPSTTSGQKIVCPQCGAENNANSDYCWSCGKQLH